MIKKRFLFFLTNGAALGIIGWITHYNIYKYVNISNIYFYSLLAFFINIFLLIINFIIQSKFIFKAKGKFFTFVLSNIISTFLITIFCSIYFKIFLLLGDQDLAEQLSFPISSITVAFFSYYILKKIVFSN
jgi:hypothetical protein